VASTGLAAPLANEGGGAEDYDAATPATLRTLFGTANGLAVTHNADSITVDNTLTGANLGTGAPLFAAKSGAALQFNSLAAGPGVTISLASGTLTISATGSGSGSAPVSAPLNTQLLTATGSYDTAAALAAGAKWIDFVMCGGGGGGGSGRRGTSNSIKQGGGGGSAGAITTVRYLPLSLLSVPEPFTSGAGGLGGAARLSDSINGASGAPGGASTFYIYKALGGLGGAGGTTAATFLPGARSIVYAIGNHTDTLETLSVFAAGGTATPSCAGGGAGGLLSETTVFFDARCDSSVSCDYLSLAPVTVTAAGNTPGATGVNFGPYPYSTGGAGGVGTATTGQPGGNGVQGGGGGGGSPSANGNPSGAGGNGGNGWILVYAYG